MVDYDRKIANKKFEELTSAIQMRDEEQLTSLFSKESVKTSVEFDKAIEELFDYFEGSVESYDDWGGLYVSTEREEDQVLQVIESSYDVITTESEYRFAIQYVTKDTLNPDQVGVRSLYVIKMEDDTDPQYAYWGDGKNTPGINIGIPNAE